MLVSAGRRQRLGGRLPLNEALSQPGNLCIRLKKGVKVDDVERNVLEGNQGTEMGQPSFGRMTVAV